MQDDGFDPDLDEMETTTLRNRGAKSRRNAPPGPVAPSPMRARKPKFGPSHGDQPEEGDNPFQGTAPLKKSKETNSQPKDKGGHHIAIIISPMSNPVEERRQSIRSDIQKAIKTEKRRGPR